MSRRGHCSEQDTHCYLVRSALPVLVPHLRASVPRAPGLAERWRHTLHRNGGLEPKVGEAQGQVGMD